MQCGIGWRGLRAEEERDEVSRGSGLENIWERGMVEERCMSQGEGVGGGKRDGDRREVEDINLPFACVPLEWI